MASKDNAKGRIESGAAAPQSKIQARSGASEMTAAFLECGGIPPLLSFAVAPNFPVRILGADCEGDSAARGELRGDDRLTRRAGFDEIVEDAVGHRFVKRSLIAIRREIKFERFAFDAQAIRDVIDVDPGEIGLASDRTNGSEIVRFKMNPVISACWIRESLKPRLRRRSGQSHFASPEQCEPWLFRLRHISN
jgi:hypothetical protein